MSATATAVVLAAGGARRFGDELKQLMPVGGEPLVRRLCRRALAAGLEPVMVVVGCRAGEVAAAVAGLAVQVVENDAWEEGQSTSVRAGLDAAPESAAGALFVPADQPLLDEETLRRLAGRAEPDGGTIVVPAFAGQRGAPVLFGRRYFDELRTISGDEGGRQILARHAASVVEVELESELPLLDLDAPEDLSRLAEAAGILALRNPVRAYAWGSRTFLPRLLGETAPSVEPQAELWLGAHPSAPSLVLRAGKEPEPLDAFVRRDPVGVLGARTDTEPDERLPFLLKVLAAAEPLSLQVHPDADQARTGFAREDARGLDLDDPARNYRDPWPKPEILCALEPFWALHGFRPPGEIAEGLGLVAPVTLAAEIDALARATSESGALEGLLCALLDLDSGRRCNLDRELTERLARGDDGASTGEARARVADALHWLRVLRRLHPGDPTVLAPLVLNLVRLEPGQALYTEAGVLHSYLEGAGVELQASSDNVLRGGLTVKHVDRGELLRVVRFRTTTVQILEPPPAPGGEAVYDTPARELRLSVLHLEEDEPYRRPRGAAVEILLCVEGSCSVELDGLAARCLTSGGSLLVTATAAPYELRGTGRVFRATVPH
jgi:mannose-6-phosphate isomerase